MPMQLLFLQDRYLFLPGLIDFETQSDYVRVCFKWEIIIELRKMENYLPLEI